MAGWTNITYGKGIKEKEGEEIKRQKNRITEVVELFQERKKIAMVTEEINTRDKKALQEKGVKEMKI